MNSWIVLGSIQVCSFTNLRIVRLGERAQDYSSDSQLATATCGVLAEPLAQASGMRLACEPQIQLFSAHHTS